MFGITKEIRGILLSSEGIVSFVGDNIFPLIAPEGTEGDYITYQRDEFSQSYTKMGVAEQRVIINIIAVSSDYERSNSIAALIYDTLSGRFRNPDISVQLEDCTEDFMDDKFIQVLQFSIKQI